jgi:hypothetical protein
MREPEVVEVSAQWLKAAGWAVDREVAFCDLVARRGAQELRVEAKGDTASPGLDVDTMYGQLLRRMVADDAVTYAIVGPEKTASAMLRVPAAVRTALRISVFAVKDTGEVVTLE